MTHDLPESDLALDDVGAVRARQHSRAKVMALLLGAFVVLVFAISIVKIQIAHG